MQLRKYKKAEFLPDAGLKRDKKAKFLLDAGLKRDNIQHSRSGEAGLVLDASLGKERKGKVWFHILALGNALCWVEHTVMTGVVQKTAASMSLPPRQGGLEEQQL
jgi:hypothetical protein